MIISFSGIDGAGKSTQISLLQQYFESQGKKCSVLWARGGYTPGMELLKFILRALSANRLPSSGSQERNEQLKRPIVAKIWMIAAIGDLIIYWGIYTRLLGLAGRNVILDRYLEDTRIDFRKNFPQLDVEKWGLWKILEAVSPVPDKSFLLWVEIEIALQRLELKKEPFPDSAETLSWRLENYLDSTSFPRQRYIRLNCADPSQIISEKIVQDLEKLESTE